MKSEDVQIGMLVRVSSVIGSWTIEGRLAWYSSAMGTGTTPLSTFSS
jgi:hypothetical protein